MFYLKVSIVLTAKAKSESSFHVVLDLLDLAEFVIMKNSKCLDKTFLFMNINYCDGIQDGGEASCNTTIFYQTMADDNIVTGSQNNLMTMHVNNIDKNNRHLNFITFRGRPSLLCDKR